MSADRKPAKVRTATAHEAWQLYWDSGAPLGVLGASRDQDGEVLIRILTAEDAAKKGIQ